MAKRRMASVLELAKYKIGDKAYWLVARPIRRPMLVPVNRKDWQWSLSVHPKIRFRLGFMKSVWPYPDDPPKLHACDFTHMIWLLTHTFRVEVFKINYVLRSVV